ncbi:MAG: hypothetical protein Q9209_003521 [Squamulea sp. 1 TL-2023]
MPFNLFKSPSTSKRPNPTSSLTSTIFPTPEITYAISASILLRAHTTTLESVTSADTQQFLTELYGCEPSLHWVWIACSFPLSSIDHALSHHTPSLPRSQRKALHDFCKQQQAEESERKKRYHERQGRDAGNAYAEGEKKRKEGEVKDLEKIMLERREKLPLKVRYIWTEGHPFVYYEREGDGEDDNLRVGKRAN